MHNENVAMLANHAKREYEQCRKIFLRTEDQSSLLRQMNPDNIINIIKGAADTINSFAMDMIKKCYASSYSRMDDHARFNLMPSGDMEVQMIQSIMSCNESVYISIRNYSEMYHHFVEYTCRAADSCESKSYGGAAIGGIIAGLALGPIGAIIGGIAGSALVEDSLKTDARSKIPALYNEFTETMDEVGDYIDEMAMCAYDRAISYVKLFQRAGYLE